jgi:hypothetical protein
LISAPFTEPEIVRSEFAFAAFIKLSDPIEEKEIDPTVFESNGEDVGIALPAPFLCIEELQTNAANGIQRFD